MTLTVTDDDTPGLVIAPTELALTEATTDPATHMQTYTVKLATQPTAAVTVTVTNGDAGAVTVAPPTLPFTDANWATAQAVTVTAVVDAGDYRDETVTLTHTVSSLDTSYASLSADVRVTVDDQDTLPMLGPGADTTINGHRVTVTSAGETPAVTVTPPAGLNGVLEVVIQAVGETVPRASARFALDEATVVDIAVRGAGLATVQTAGLEICLPVSAALRAEALALERELKILHYQNDAWTGVAGVEDRGERLCATVTAFSPFAVGYSDEKLGFADTGRPLVYYTGTAARAAAVDLPGATGGDGRITYTLTPVLPAGLTYTPPAAEAKHGGTITGTPTTRTAPQPYTLTATDEDGDTASLTFPIEVSGFTLTTDMTKTRTVNGYTVTEVRKSGTPGAVTVEPPRTLAGHLEVVMQPVAATVPMEGTRFALGAEAAHRTVVDLVVRGAGLATVQTAGLEICLPVSAALRAEALALERELKILHYQNDAWTGVAGVEDRGERLCATVTAFFPFAVGYSDEKLGFADTGRPLVYYTGTAARAAAVDLPGATGGDGRITYTLTRSSRPG